MEAWGLRAWPGRMKGWATWCLVCAYQHVSCLLLCLAVCTLADLSYDIYHATIDCCEQDGTAQQEFYIRWEARRGGAGTARAREGMRRQRLSLAV